MPRSTVSHHAPEYRLPPPPIPHIVDAPPTPALTLAPDRSALALLGRANLPDISELAEPELRLAGTRINPRTNGPSRESYYTSVRFRSLLTERAWCAGLPEEMRISHPRWAPDASRLAFVNTTTEGLELWVVEVFSGEARRLSGADLNGAFGLPFAWMPDGGSILAARIAPGRGAPPPAPAVPHGPVVHESLGRTAPGRTYQDLLDGPHSEALFDHYFTSQLWLFPTGRGAPTAVGDPGIISDFAPSPSGEYLLVERIHRPYSYVVPHHRFPSEVRIVTPDGAEVARLADLPLAEDVPVVFDAVPAGPRGFQWRADAPHQVAWVEALDGGDPRVPAERRDRLLTLEAPFASAPAPLMELEHRFAGIQWGRDDYALVYSRWWSTRTERRHAVSPGMPEVQPRLVVERSFQDRYGDPGTPVMTRTRRGGSTLLFSPDGNSVYLAGEGASPRGDYPFLDTMDLETGRTERLWRSEDPFYEEVAAMIDADGPRFLTRRESAAEPPNFHLLDLRDGASIALTDFADPAPELAGIGRRIITYDRPDGVELSATLYTPPGYDGARDGPLPLLMWAYPREFLSAADAGQVDDSPNRFSRPTGASHLFLLTQGYAILDGPAMPIVGETEPNDSYVEQLVSSAEAAVEAVVGMGVADRGRIAVGGHSYGAFMTANLLAHTELFRAGIARSGAYNRTLTPFGFQQEQRTYWEAAETYHRMSPFTFADRIRAPILLIHGEMDNNSGTFPLQSERFYQALKGHGATVRYVVLPHESHAYRARQSVLHALAEMVEWLERHMKSEG